MLPFSILLAALLLAAILLRGYFPYLWIDLTTFWRMLLLARRVEGYRKQTPPVTLLDVFLQQVEKNPGKAFLIFEGRSFSYREVDRQSNRVSRCLQAAAVLREGDCVAMFVDNQPLFLTVWLGLAKLGCAAAFLNTNSRGKSLLYSVQCSGAHCLITAPELWSSVEDVLPSLREENVTVFVVGGDCTAEGAENLNHKIQTASDEPLPRSLRSHVTFNSPFVYIYTSGTTGLPKAAVIPHGRAHRMASFILGCGLSSNDVIYTTLPLYHSAASMIGICGCIFLGATVILRRKFSVSHFWGDCREHDVTIIQYIGEVLRYLCNAPKRNNDGDHKVRIAIGNGARADVWKEFLNRFGDIRVCEFYGATEGNIGFLNYVGKIGASGRVTVFSRTVMPFHLVKYDVEQEAPVRDSNGHCIEAPQGETGLLIAKITAKSPFIGYVGNESLTAKKHLRDVFSKGDLYFNSGDLMMLDHENFIYFQDRIGDTYRWKGENVSTNEVADILSMLDFVQEACVYGVTVPGLEGRAGMAAIQLQSGSDFDGAQLYGHVTTNLPSYARPRFLRQQTRIETTGTFKYYKVTLVKEGFNPTTVQDSLFFLDDQKRSYMRMDEGIYNSIITGQIRL